jgi:DNA-binding GntR family transcriptional regulator
MPKVAEAGQFVYEHLRRALLTGQLVAGDRLVELELAESLGVSRTPVREALRRLEGDGFVQRDGPRGVVALGLEPEDVDDIALVRVEIDTLAARLARQRATPEQWDDMAGFVARMRAADDPDVLDDLHRSFHRAIFAAAFRPRMLAVLEQHILQHLEVTRITARLPATPRRMHVQHQELLDTLLGDDDAAAETLARSHAGLNARQVRRIVERRGEELR